MKLDINLSQYSKEFINEIAKKTTSAEILDQIVDFAIDIDHYYSEGSSEFESDDSFYIDSVIKNKNVSKESIKRLIRYQASGEIHMVLVEEEKLSDNELVELFVKEVQDLSAIEYFLRNYTVSEELADIIAKRIINNSIYIEKCFNFSVENDEEYISDAMDLICTFCSVEMRNELEKWWEAKYKKMRKKKTTYADIIAKRIMSEKLGTKLPSRTTYIDNAIRDIAGCCSNEVGNKLRLWWEKQKKL